MHRLPRAFRLRQQFPLLHRQAQNRQLSRSIWRRQYTEEVPLRTQQVRFKRPGFTTKRLLTWGIYLGAVYGFSSFVLRHLEIEVEFVGEDEMEEGAEGEEVSEEDMVEVEVGPDGQVYADPESTFIPMTWAVKQPRTYYRGSDPEWQAFVKVARDKKRCKQIQDELVRVVYTGTQHHPMISRQLGRNTKVGKYWLDINFPDGPPPEYERSGIEIGDGYVAWSAQRIQSEQQWRITRALWPKAAFESSYATAKVLAGIQYRRFKQAIGWEGKDPLSPEERFKHAMDMMAKHQAAKEGGASRVGKPQLDPEGTGSSGVVGSPSSSTSAPSQSSTAEGPKLPYHFPVPLPPTSATSETDLPIAMHTFSQSLNKNWNPKKQEPPRGSFVVGGMVEVRGSRGRMLFDVQSCYDPQQSKYVVVNAGVRGYKKWNQSPRGGP
ncbi:hypothetical protein MBLNU230_g4424t1 [Neophaeotheca triangularis]